MLIYADAYVQLISMAVIHKRVGFYKYQYKYNPLETCKYNPLETCNYYDNAIVIIFSLLLINYFK